MLLPPTPMPGETIYSLLVRHQLISGYSPRQFLTNLFGKCRLSIHPYLPAYLQVLVNHGYAKPSWLMHHHTLLRLFAFFLPSQAHQIHQAMLCHNGSAPTTSALLPHTKGGALLSLKECPCCAHEDLKQHGFSYWHTDHQIPGITACARHGVKLLKRPPSIHQNMNFGLPDSTNLTELATPAETELARFSSTLLNHHTQTKNPDFPNIYRHWLALKGFVTKTGRIRRKYVLEELFAYWGTLPKETLTYLPVTDNKLSILHSLLGNKTHSNQHPTKHMMFACWLMESPQDYFTHNYKRNAFKSHPSRKPAQEAKCIGLLRTGVSLTKTSKLTGKSYCYLKRLAHTHQIANTSNLSPEAIQRNRTIWRKALYGVHRQDIADQLEVSIGTVEAVISQDPSLVRWRKTIRQNKLKCTYRQKVADYRSAHPKAYIKDIREHCASAYAWLYLYDKQWLQICLPQPLKTKQNKRVDWAERDTLIAEKAKEMLLKQKSRVSRSKLDDLLGRHNWLIKHKDKFPLTLAVLEQHNRSPTKAKP